MRWSLCFALLVCLLLMGTSATLAQGGDGAGDARIIELEADAALRFTQDGEQIQDTDVTPGETVLFRIDNTAGFEHSFYIGTDVELRAPNGSTDIGIPVWTSGVRELVWTVPEDISAFLARERRADLWLPRGLPSGLRRGTFEDDAFELASPVWLMSPVDYVRQALVGVGALEDREAVS